ncbi:hypothetical protein CC86DRAFT_400617 [Ophiobolus disseminans]|uniref:F-box domain-containing protein n=1 Tax=Ophiobolus disseminans TaxID=1469910 RepID=A0A6A7ALN7_9PLEO|nr:hypothetical protein CC86DRAFT_400617 [Ophiobolus disseminans]
MATIAALTLASTIVCAIALTTKHLAARPQTPRSLPFMDELVPGRPIDAALQSNSSKLLAPPTEIREIIYYHAMRVDGHFNNALCASTPTASHNRTVSKCLPALCFITKTESNLPRIVFFRNVDFYLYRDGDAEILNQWLSKYRAFGFVKHMHLSYLPQHRYIGFGKDLALLSHCPQVRELHLSLPVEALADYWPAWIWPYPEPGRKMRRMLSSKEIRHKFQLESILSCGQLHTVRLILWSARVRYNERHFRGTGLMENLARIKRKFKRKHGRDTAIKLEWANDEGMSCDCTKCLCYW